MSDVAVDDLTDPELVYQIGIEPVRIDILMGVKGLDFEDRWPSRVMASFDGVDTPFISVGDLVKLTGVPLVRAFHKTTPAHSL